MRPVSDHYFSEMQSSVIQQTLLSKELKYRLNSVKISDYTPWQLGCHQDDGNFKTYGFSIEVDAQFAHIGITAVSPILETLNIELKLSGPFIGISPKNITKGAALTRFMNTNYILPNTVIGIGDAGHKNGNDLSFLSLPNIHSVYVGNKQTAPSLINKPKDTFTHLPGHTIGTQTFLNQNADKLKQAKLLVLDVDGTIATEDPTDHENCIMSDEIAQQLLTLLDQNKEIHLLFITARGNLTYVDTLQSQQFNYKKLGVFFNKILLNHFHTRVHIIGLDGGRYIQWCTKNGKIKHAECMRYEHFKLV